MQSVSGLHSGTNPISGDFSVGAVGLMVRDGEFAEPVREVTIASTLQRMLLDVTEVGDDLTYLPGRGGGRDDAGRRHDAQRRLTDATEGHAWLRSTSPARPASKRPAHRRS